MDREVLRVGSARAFGGSIWDVWNVRTGAVEPVSVDANARITHVTPDLVVGFTTDALGVKTPARWGRR